MGIELQVAEGMGTPIILCFHKGNEYQVPPVGYQNPDTTQHMLQIGEGCVSLMALGIPTVFKVIGYQTEDEVTTSVVNAVRLFRKADG
jgi:hypothetical protein